MVGGGLAAHAPCAVLVETDPELLFLHQNAVVVGLGQGLVAVLIVGVLKAAVQLHISIGVGVDLDDLILVEVVFRPDPRAVLVVGDLLD